MPVRRLDDYLRRVSERVERGGMDIDSFVRKLAEALVDEIAEKLNNRLENDRSCITFSELKTLITNIVDEKLSRLEKEIRELKRRVEELSRLSMSFGATAAATRRPQDQGPRWLITLAKAVEEEGFKLASQLPRDVVDMFDSKTAETKGIYAIDVDGDIVFVKADTLTELAKSLSAVKVGDEAAAAAKLGGRLARLFMLLRRSGYLVYSSREKAWVPVGELKKLMNKVVEGVD